MVEKVKLEALGEYCPLNIFATQKVEVGALALQTASERGKT